MPSSIPPSALGIPTASGGDEDSGAASSDQPKPRFVVSQSGAAAHPDEIVASCQALREHVARLQEDAERELRAFEERIRERDLAEKRRLAPGWLDSDARLLQPEKSAAARAEAENEPMIGEPQTTGPSADEGAALDRAFGGMNLK